MILISFLLVLAVAIITTGVTALLTLPGMPAAFAMIAATVWVGWAALTVLSFHVMKPGIRKAVFFLGTFEGVYVNGSDWEETRRRYVAAHRREDFHLFCRRGFHLIGMGDIVFLPLPFYYDVRDVTTGIVRIPIKITQGVFTAVREHARIIRTDKITRKKAEKDKNGKVTSVTVIGHEEKRLPGPTGEVDPLSPPVLLPSTRSIKPSTEPNEDDVIVETVTKYEIARQRTFPVEMEVDVEILISLGVNIGAFVQRLPQATLGDTKKLGEELSVAGVEPVVQEALIEAVAGFRRQGPGGANDILPFPGLTWEGDLHIVAHREELERRVTRLLREKTSMLVEAGLLQPWAPGTNNAGAAAETFDIAVERVIPHSEELRKKIGLVSEARYDAEATRERERGLTDALDERAKKLDVSSQVVIMQDTVKHTTATIVTVDKDTLSGLSRLVPLASKGKGRGERRARRE